MEKIKEIYKVLNEINPLESGYNVKKLGKAYWGKGANDEIIFAIDIYDEKIQPVSQVTKYLTIHINRLFEVQDEKGKSLKKFSVIVLNKEGNKYLEVFIRLTQSFITNSNNIDLLSYFLNLKDLFTCSNRSSEKELQGMYGELFVMYMLKINFGIDISNYYQSEDHRKFDFSISENKKIEIKSTMRPIRIHHFLQEQLNIYRYDIKIFSLMFLKDDKGMSLYDLIIKCNDIFADKLDVILHIEKMIKNVDKIELKMIRFNYNYTKENFRIYDAKDVPRVKEKTEDGVFNIEFDSDLTMSDSISAHNFMEWIIK